MIFNKKKYVVVTLILLLANTIFPNLYNVYAITTEGSDSSGTIFSDSETILNEKIENSNSTLLDQHVVQEDISVASIEENNPDSTYYNEEDFPNIETSLNPPTIINEETSIFTEGNSPYALSDEVNERAKRIEETINSFDFKILMDFYQVDFSNTVPDRDESDESLGKSYNLTDLEQSFTKLQMNSKEFSNAYVMAYPESLDDRLSEIVILSSYFIRWYDIRINDESLWTQLFFTPEILLTEVTNKEEYLVNLMDSILGNPKNMLSSHLVNENIKSKLFPGINSTFSSYKEIIETFVFAQTGSTDYSNWFYSYFKGYVYKDKLMFPKYDVGIWNRSKDFTNFLPYLLSLENDNNLVVGETRGEILFTSTTVYGNDLEQTNKESG